MDLVQTFWDFANSIILSKFYDDFGIWFLFFYAGTPSLFFIPNEFFALPLAIKGVSPFLMVIVVGIGGFLGDSLLYYAGRHGSDWVDKHILKKHAKKEMAKANHLLHKYKHFIFVLSPSLPFGIGDMINIVAGKEHVIYNLIAPWILVGNLIRGVIVVFAVYGILSIPYLGVT